MSAERDTDRGASRTDVAYRTIKAEIFAQRLLPREPLVETELGARYGMSKTPVREALLALAREGLVEVTPFRGVRVRHFTNDDVREIYELREALEPLAVIKAAARMNGDHLGQLREILVAAEQAAETDDRRELSRLNRLFHDMLVAPCGNSRIVEVLGRLQDQLRLMALALWAVRRTYEHESKQHWEILEALEAGDAELAASRLRSHIAEFCERYVEQTSR